MCVKKCTSFCQVLKKDAQTHPFNGSFYGTTQVSWYQKGKTNLDFTETRDSEWQWHQLGRTQVCTSLQTDNHTSTPPLSFSQAGCPSCHQPTVSKPWRQKIGSFILPHGAVVFTISCLRRIEKNAKVVVRCTHVCLFCGHFPGFAGWTINFCGRPADYISGCWTDARNSIICTQSEST